MQFLGDLYLLSWLVVYISLFLFLQSFYLPGSIDVNNNNELDDWNLCPPPLYLWSHPDWSAKHKAIAHQHGHFSRIQEPSHFGKYPKNKRGREQQFGPYQKEITDSRGYNGSCAIEIDWHARISAIRSNIRLYGQQDSITFGQRNGLLGGPVPGLLSSAADSSYMVPNPNTFGQRISFLERQVPGLLGSVADSSYSWQNNRNTFEQKISFLRGQVPKLLSSPADSSYSWKQDPNPFEERSSFLGGQVPGHLGSAADSSYNGMNMPTMQRYAPQHCELNHARMNTSGYELVTAGRKGIFDPRASRSGYIVDSMFASGAYQPFLQSALQL